MDSKKTIKVYPCKTILNHLSDTDTDSIYRLRVGLPYNYEEACSLCERDKPIWQWRYPNRGDLRGNVIRIDYRKGVFWASEDPAAFARSERGGRFCHLLTNARVLMDRCDPLKGFSSETHHALPFTTAGLDGVTRVLDLLPPSSVLPRSLLDIRIERGTFLIPAAPFSIQGGCVVREAARWGREILVIKKPLLEEVLFITEGEGVSLFVQGVSPQRPCYNEAMWWGRAGREFLGQGRYLDLSGLGVGSHHIVCRLAGNSGPSDAALLTIVVRPKPKMKDSLLVRCKGERVDSWPKRV